MLLPAAHLPRQVRACKGPVPCGEGWMGMAGLHGEGWSAVGG